MTTGQMAKKAAVLKKRSAAVAEREEPASAGQGWASLGDAVGALVTGWGAGDANMVTGQDSEDMRGAGLTVEELSELLRRREARGRMKGYEEGARVKAQLTGRAVREARAEVAEATLRMCAQQLEPVLKQFAAAARKSTAAERARAHGDTVKALTLLAAELGRVAEQVAADRSF